MALEKFTDTIFLKEDSNLQKQFDALKKLHIEYPENKQLEEELYTVKKGLDGEKEIKYQLSKANIGMYVLHDVNYEYKDLKAQVDYIVVTKAFCYFIECKNLVGNITVTDKGDFIREYSFNGKTIKKGMYSPLRQVEAQRAVFKKIVDASWKDGLWEKAKRYYFEKNFERIHRTLVVVANPDAILKLYYAPKEIKGKVIKADALVRTIEQDLAKAKKDEITNQKETWEWAMAFKKRSTNVTYDYYKIFKEKFVTEAEKQEKLKKENDMLKEKLIEFRINRAKQKKFPEHYVFTDEELEKIIELKPRTKEELENANILPKIKVQTHGDLIIKIINE